MKANEQTSTNNMNDKKTDKESTQKSKETNKREKWGT